ncbi:MULTISPECIES: FdhF/YdeP family oxidoreductase [unclassified Bradyrhizobium]|uniref:FdhF/YdeP family oxidoreductase n=1 Tax=unclassified Bradyrhizobium TaxID=2631580 RepID=UPI0004185155|nr:MULTISPECIES: FdhF/YdeP family oxidoreductase [unclassified Bradyrhizobium]QIG91402.1 FdhF/YdeP family oxidoreductase [Bradyrhizobium sp. 6(2017)]
MVRKRDVPGIRPYDAPAGGWGALKATATAVRDQMDLVEAPITLLRTNKPDGFDCPGCAWPDKEHTSTFQFCENGAKAVTWEATSKRVTPEFFAGHTVTELLTWSDFHLENEGRLTEPLAYDAASDTYQPIAWDDAFARIGASLRSLPDPDMAEFYTSGRASNEAAFLFQIFAREYGSNNFPDCSNMCHEATSVGLPQSIGIGKGTVSLDDFDHCELIIAMGHNPGTNHPRMMGTLWEVSRRGVPIIVFNPLRERALERFADPQDPIEMATFSSTRIASTYYQPKVGADAAVLKGVMKALIEKDDVAKDVLDHAFIAEHTNGFAAFAADLRGTAWDAIEAVSGFTRAQLGEVAAAYAKSNATIVTYGMGITQHSHGTDNVQQIANLLLLKGNYGKPGAGICPLRGHSNVQGNRTVGITEKPNIPMFEGIERTFGFKPPRHQGHDAVAAMEAIDDGRSKVLICLGGNFAIALPDPERCTVAMRKLELAVHLGTKLNRSHLLVGKQSIILPVLGRTERDIQASGPQVVTVEDSMSMVHASRGKLTPASAHLRSESAIVAGIAMATLPASKVPWAELIADYDRIRDAIEGVFPDFKDYNARIRIPGGFRLPLPPTERKWTTPSGKAEFLIFDGLEEDPVLSDNAVLKLTTIRSHDQYNTTIYGLNDRYRGVFGRRDVLFTNAADLAELGLAHGDLVEIETALPSGAPRRLTLTAIAYDIARGSVAAYYPEANGLVPLDYQDKESGTPSYKSVPVHIRRADKAA